ncbi:rod shape-determining protein MreC [Paracoccaceae bacterium]|nr:rod shape-determining protein MreC [Paracoccaceae bacterium]MDC3205224.1 rod shape-determining protein MreC [Paracoccaceae bacterium]
MNNDRQTQADYFAPLRRLITVVLLLILFGLFVVWRIDNPRVEKFRALVIDTFVPNFEWILRPMTSVVKLAQDYRSYEKLLEQNKELRRELQQMKSWKEAALQLEQENARLLDLNQLRLDSKLTHVSGIVIADSGSPFRQSVLLNIGSRDGIQDGWAAMDGLGLVGRISGVGSSTSRVILLTDNASQIPVIVQPSGQRAILMGDNSFAPPVEFIENVDLVRPGDRVVTSGGGGVLPAGLLVGTLAMDPNGRLRARLVADYERLEFLKVLRDYGTEKIESFGSLIKSKETSPDVSITKEPSETVNEGSSE